MIESTFNPTDNITQYITGIDLIIDQYVTDFDHIIDWYVTV